MRLVGSLGSGWHFVSTPEELDAKLSKGISPRYIFFPHWRWIVPKSILQKFECVCFHMTDVPYGRGGSPLQNLIVRGHKQTLLTALMMDEGVDSGPVYMKAPLSLDGYAKDIYKKVSELSWELIETIVDEQPVPEPQSGEVVIFKRRTPKESLIPDSLNLQQVYDFIRMLDAPGYPQAFLQVGDYCLKFEKAEYEGGEVSAVVSITLKE